MQPLCRVLGTFALALALCPPVAHAQAFPTKPLRLIAPFAVGGSAAAGASQPKLPSNCLGSGVVRDIPATLPVGRVAGVAVRPGRRRCQSEAMSCSTRSSRLVNGSLQSTVRCAWSLSFRCTQSTV